MLESHSSPTLYSQWMYTAESDTDVFVMPDGCLDVLIIEEKNSERKIRLTEWDDCPRSVQMVKDMKITGFRLRPGMSINPEDLANLEANEYAVKEFIENAAIENSDSIEVIQALSNHQHSFQQVARQTGVSPRTLQRHFKRLGLAKPEFWRLLSRARIAATALPSQASLTDIANTYGYSDQSHMTREFSRWFGTTPSQLRHSPQLLTEICQPGLGTWTFEQISMR